MYSNNYAKEIGVKPDERIVPLKFALPALALVFAGVCFGVVTSADASRSVRHKQKAPSSVLVAGQTIASR